MRPLPYEELKRPLPDQTPQDRTKLALTVGLLLADGFFAVEAEQFFDLEPIGRVLLNHSKVLGSGTRISSHMKSVLEKGAKGEWDALKEELVRTQKDVEKEMVLIFGPSKSVVPPRSTPTIRPKPPSLPGLKWSNILS